MRCSCLHALPVPRANECCRFNGFALVQQNACPHAKETTCSNNLVQIDLTTESQTQNAKAYWRKSTRGSRSRERKIRFRDRYVQGFHPGRTARICTRKSQFVNIPGSSSTPGTAAVDRQRWHAWSRGAAMESHHSPAGPYAYSPRGRRAADDSGIPARSASSAATVLGCVRE